MNANDFVQASNRHLLISIFGSLIAVLCCLLVVFSQRKKGGQK
jgi:hypothetical protein